MFRSFVAALLFSSSASLVRAICSENQYEMSVEGVEGIYCVDSYPICLGDAPTGACPTATTGLPYGSYCGVVASGVYGCKVHTADSLAAMTPAVAPSPVDPAPAPVDPVPAPIDPVPAPVDPVPAPVDPVPAPVDPVPAPVDPVPAPVDPVPAPVDPVPAPVDPAPAPVDPVPAPVDPVPAPVDPVPAPVDPAPAPAPASAPLVPPCGPDQSEMSVEGVAQIFCISGTACAADIATGNCPGAQPGLEFGSYCGVVSSGVYGCKPYADGDSNPVDVTYDPPTTCPEGQIPIGVAGGETGCAAQPVCAGTIFGNCPASSDCTTVAPGVYGCALSVAPADANPALEPVVGVLDLPLPIDPDVWNGELP